MEYVYYIYKKSCGGACECKIAKHMYCQESLLRRLSKFNLVV